MSKHCKECCEILFSYLLNLCCNNENMCRDIKFPFQIESIIDYVVTQKDYVAT